MAWQLFILFVAAGFSSFDTWASNPEGPSFTRSALIAGFLFLGAALLRGSLVLLGFDNRGATYSAGLLVFIFSNGGDLIGLVPLGRLGVVAAALLASLIVYRFRDSPMVRFLFAWGAIALFVIPPGIFAGSRVFAPPGSDLAGEPSILHIEPERDVVIVLLDGYAGNPVLEEFFGYDNSIFTNQLARDGFDIDAEARAPYPSTQLSVASVIQMDYVLGEGILSDSDSESLCRVLGAKALCQSLSSMRVTHSSMSNLVGTMLTVGR